MSSIFYAQLDSDNVCSNICEYGQTLDNVPSNYLAISTFDDSLVGRTWDGSAWSEVVEATVEELAREWRDIELLTSDFAVPLTDHPNHAAYMTYRAALRGWPSTADFPATKPTL